jgi:hypothetical protein
MEAYQEEMELPVTGITKVGLYLTEDDIEQIKTGRNAITNLVEYYGDRGHDDDITRLILDLLYNKHSHRG